MRVHVVTGPLCFPRGPSPSCSPQHSDSTQGGHGHSLVHGHFLHDDPGMGGVSVAQGRGLCRLLPPG